MANMSLTKINLIREMERRRGGEYGGQMAYGRDEPWEPEHRRMPYMPPYGSPGMTGRNGAEMRKYYRARSGYEGGMPMDRRKMGFGEDEPVDYGTDMRRRRRSDGTFMHYGGMEEEDDEPIRFGGMIAMRGGKDKSHQRMTREIAEEWTGAMEGADPAKPHGAKWTPEQVKPIAAKYGVPTEGDRFWEFYAVMNAMYSDYYVVAKKYNQLTPDFFADMAMAFISDKDAVENKVMMYYECIVEK